jgi:hypothetical protein
LVEELRAVRSVVHLAELADTAALPDLLTSTGNASFYRRSGCSTNSVSMHFLSTRTRKRSVVGGLGAGILVDAAMVSERRNGFSSGISTLTSAKCAGRICSATSAATPTGSPITTGDLR